MLNLVVGGGFTKLISLRLVTIKKAVENLFYLEYIGLDVCKVCNKTFVSYANLVFWDLIGEGGEINKKRL